MKCIYREKKYECGPYLEVDIYPVYEYQRGRGRKRKPTSDTMKRLNQINAEKKLIRLLNTNFTAEDIRFDLTYSAENEPSDPQEAQRELTNFLRRVKRYRAKKGLPELKYVAVTEQGSRSGRLHHHIVMSGGLLVSELTKLWGRGYTTAKALVFDENGITGIAKYLVKNPILNKRWNASKNLEQPKESKRDGRLSARKVTEWNLSGADNRRDIEKEYPGYFLSEINTYWNEVNGGVYIVLNLYKKEGVRNDKHGNNTGQVNIRSGRARYPAGN